MPWAISYWQESYPYWVHKWPPNEQDVVPSPPSLMPTNPSDPGPWTWQKYWTYTYESKILGAFTSGKVMMHPENLPNYPSLGRVKVHTPHASPHSIGAIKVHMPPQVIYISPHLPLWKAKQKLNRGEIIDFTEDDRKWIKKQWALTPVYVTPEDNIWGPRVRKVAPNWLQHTQPISADDIRKFINDDMREVSTQLNKARRERWAQKVPKRARKQPSKDLFS
jgi:hypothetical protein